MLILFYYSFDALVVITQFGISMNVYLLLDYPFDFVTPVRSVLVIQIIYHTSWFCHLHVIQYQVFQIQYQAFQIQYQAFQIQYQVFQIRCQVQYVIHCAYIICHIGRLTLIWGHLTHDFFVLILLICIGLGKDLFS